MPNRPSTVTRELLAAGVWNRMDSYAAVSFLAARSLGIAYIYLVRLILLHYRDAVNRHVLTFLAQLEDPVVGICRGIVVIRIGCIIDRPAGRRLREWYDRYIGCQASTQITRREAVTLEPKLGANKGTCTFCAVDPYSPSRGQFYVDHRRGIVKSGERNDLII